jgi:hypothetical protein
MIDETLLQNVHAYARQHQLQVAEALGDGIHGSVWAAEIKLKAGKSALKAHRFAGPYSRERSVYERLRDAKISKICGLNVPLLIGADDLLRVIEMTVVPQPFVLDFAGAYLDAPPEFSEEIWAGWEDDKREMFESRWPAVQAVLAELERFGIYLVDVSPKNIAFVSSSG